MNADKGQYADKGRYEAVLIDPIARTITLINVEAEIDVQDEAEQVKKILGCEYFESCPGILPGCFGLVAEDSRQVEGAFMAPGHILGVIHGRMLIFQGLNRPLNYDQIFLLNAIKWC